MAGSRMLKNTTSRRLNIMRLSAFACLGPWAPVPAAPASLGPWPDLFPATADPAAAAAWEFGLRLWLFVGLIMTPASMYMSLVIGPNDMGPAAQWVTIILFIEVARRSFTVLSRPEIFVLYYMAGASMVSSSITTS